MNKTKLATVPLLATIMLSMLGFVYSAWTDYISVEATANMGSLTLAFSTRPPSCVELYLENGAWKEGEFEGKDVASCDAYYDEDSFVTDEHTGKSGYKKLIIKVDNAYPGYAVHTTFIVHNIGTIPICVYGVDFTGEKRDSEENFVCNLVAEWWIDGVSGNIVGKIYEDVDGSGNVTTGDILVINFEVINHVFPFQLDPCQENKMEIDIDFKQEAEECHTYILEFELLGVQWNKVGEVPP